jgi:predicted MFS family arabinose efflux permease
MVCIRGPSDSGSRSYYYNDGTYNTAHRTSNGTTATESFGPNSLTYGVARKFAISVTNGSQLVSSNGATANSNTQAITSFNQTIIGFGNDAGSPLGGLTGRQHFQSFKFWPTALPQATLNSLTTL